MGQHGCCHSITIFKSKIQKSQLTKQDLFGLKLLTGYGIACTGNGMVEMYKLEMKFQNGETKFITKVALAHSEKLAAAISSC